MSGYRLRSLVPVFAGSRFGDFADKHNRALGHAREFDPLARKLCVGFFKRHMRRTARGFLGRFRKFEITRYSLFAIFVCKHTTTVRRAMTPVRALTITPRDRS